MYKELLFVLVNRDNRRVMIELKKIVFFGLWEKQTHNIIHFAWIFKKPTQNTKPSLFFQSLLNLLSLSPIFSTCPTCVACLPSLFAIGIAMPIQPVIDPFVLAQSPLLYKFFVLLFLIFYHFLPCKILFYA